MTRADEIRRYDRLASRDLARARARATTARAAMTEQEREGWRVAAAASAALHEARAEIRRLADRVRGAERARDLADAERVALLEAAEAGR